MADVRVRVLLLGVAALQLVAAILFATGALTETMMWPYPGTSPLSGLLLASFAAAAAASTVWCVVGSRERAVVGIGIDYLAIFGPFGAYTLIRLGDLGTNGVVFLSVCGGSVLIGAWMVWWGLRHDWRDRRPTPRPVLAAFAIFVIALVIASSSMLFRVPNILPWVITPDLSVLFGFAFLGAAAYFLYGLIERRWENAGGQLAGFLAYDVVLVVPFIQRVGTIPDEFRVNMWIYLAVVIGSGLLATWYLFVRRDTRVWGQPPIGTVAGEGAAEA